MKKLLIFFLVSIIICQKTSTSIDLPSVLDSIKCLLKSNTFYNSFLKVIESFKTKDFLNIFNTLYSVFFDLKNEFIKCREKSTQIQINNFNENDDDDNINLGYPRVVLILYTQIGEVAFQWYEEGGLPLLKRNCLRDYGQRIWYCNFINIE